jgi:energy-coupling factor transport system substrate-specific component
VAAVCIALINSITGAIVAVLFFSGLTVHPVDYIVTAFLSLGQSFVSAAFWARIPINLIDKGIAVFVTFWLKILWDRRRGKGEESSVSLM